MNCPKCKSPINENSLFCKNCGELVGERLQAESDLNQEDIEKTMSIPIVREAETRECIKQPSPRPDYKERVSKLPKSPKKEASRQTEKAHRPRKEIFIFIITFLVVVVVGLSIALATVLIGRDTLPENEKLPVSENTDKPIDLKSETEEKETLEKMPEGESVGIENNESGIKINDNFDFVFGKMPDSTALTYSTLKSDDFYYECDIPTSFKFVFDKDGEIRYAAKDKTAYMDIGAFVNESSLSVADLIDKLKSDLGGNVLSQSSGDTWFSMDIEKGGVRHYQKCFLDDGYVRYFEMVYPSEYNDVYSVYINDIEPSFKVVQ